MDENDAYGITMTQVSCAWLLADHVAMWVNSTFDDAG